MKFLLNVFFEKCIEDWIDCIVSDQDKVDDVFYSVSKGIQFCEQIDVLVVFFKVGDVKECYD